MTKKTIKKALPVVIGTLVIALTTPIIPANLYVEASKGAKVSNSKSQDKKAAEKKASKKKNVDKKTIDKVKSEIILVWKKP